MLAGFETPSAGALLLDDVDLAALPPYRRPVNMMFQSYALFPHMSVAGNVAFGLQARIGCPGPRSPHGWRRCWRWWSSRRSPAASRDQLSGGQRQRVALARSLVKRPKVLLLDEPLGALDKKLREQTQFELMAIQQRVGITFVIVTHDQDEAMTVADRIAVMEEGRIAQVDTPSAIYEAPRSRYVAEFIGDVNIFEGRASTVNGGGVLVELADAPDDLAAPARADGPTAGDAVLLAVRPEKIEIAPEPLPPGTANAMAGEVTEIAYLGSVSTYRVRLDSGKTVVSTHTNRLRDGSAAIDRGARVHLSWPVEASILLRS